MATCSLVPLEGRFAVCRLPAGSPPPEWALASPWFSLTHTHEELSIVLPEDRLPDGVRAERGWRCLRVAGTLDFALVGVLASLLAPLAEADVPVFVLSTYDTDYLMIGEARFEAALGALRRAGHRVAD